MALFCYSLLWLLFRWSSKLLIPFHAGIRKQSQNRRHRADSLKEMAHRRSQFKQCVLFYCSSAGEYEQAKPLIDRLKASHYVYLIFFSASGYQYAKKLGEEADFGMAPIDTTWDWKRIFRSLKPSLAVIVRHEFWPGFILTHHQFSRTVAIDVFIREETSRLSLRLKNFLFAYLDKVFVVSEDDRKLLAPAIQQKTLAIGNTKFDRAVERFASRAENRRLIAQQIDQCLGPGRRFIVGSAWKEDVLMALDAFQRLTGTEEFKSFKLVLVPHEVGPEMIDWAILECQKRTLTCGTYSELPNTEVQVLIVDVVGILFELYACSDMALIGGGFKQGVHNIVEAAVSEIPLASGPMIRSDREAMMFKDDGLLSITEDLQELCRWLKANQHPRDTLQERLKSRIQAESGTSDKILASIKAYL